MTAIKNREKILQLVNEVPDEQLGKVVSLMGKLKKPVRKQIPGKFKVIYELMGKYKDSMSSSEGFSRRKQRRKET